MDGVLDQNVEQQLVDCNITYRVFPCNPEFADTASLAEHYGFTREQMANCILVIGKADPPRWVACIVLATCKIDVNKKVCQLIGVKRATFASPEETATMTGMMVGGVTPFGLPSEVAIYVEERVMNRPELLMGGGNRSSKLLIKPAELLKLPRVRVVAGLGIPRA